MANSPDCTEDFQVELLDGGSLDLLMRELGALQMSLNRARKHGHRERLVWPNIKVRYRLDEKDVRSPEIRRVEASRFAEVMTGTYRLENLSSLLDSLHSSTKALLERIKPNVTSAGENLGRLMQRLPEELLLRIMKLTLDFNPHECPLPFMRMMLKLSSVNKHFRRVALSHPDVWATVSTDSRIESTELYLNRSKCAKLHVEIRPTRSLDVFLDKVLPLTSRWKELSFRIPLDGEQKEIMKKACTGLHLPNLEHLQYSVETYQERYMYADNSLDDVYLSWTVPNLRSISFANISPKVFPASSIRSVHMVFADKFTDRSVTYLQGLQVFLQDSPTVDDLDISCRMYADQTWHSSSFSSLYLENIRTVEVRCVFLTWEIPEIRSLDEHPICRFLQSLHLPYLESINVQFHLDTNRHFNDQENLEMDLSAPIFSFVPSPCVNTSVKKLVLQVQGTRKTHFVKSSVTLPLRRFPNLRHLNLRIEGILKLSDPVSILDSDIASNIDTFPVLERVELGKCWGGGLKFLRDAFEAIRIAGRSNPSGGGLNRLDVVSVKRCPYVRKEDLLQIIAKEKLVFEEATITDRLRILLDSYGLSDQPKSTGD
ncbi:hypothetical protein SCHPADRAFT_931442 [Schizopora paradoxa]|uniref:Uncharacterized protein n=1 Tax=Schizopora paradoxa TaxID=27342 RepID=A0A0H2RW13_9AGAM|nr:hypothetical protein SCHPADRAFT_931442 [Schizopora paradoxa]